MVPVWISYNYDEQFNILSITEPRNRYVESYQLDIQDRVTTVTNIEGQVMSLDYSVGNFVNGITRFDGSTVSNTCDRAGRDACTTYSAAGFQPAEVSCTYYLDSQLKTTALTNSL